MVKGVIIPPSSVARVAQDFRDDKKEDDRWSNLPDELLRLILREVYYNGCRRFRATCTSWRNAAPPPQLTPNHSSYQSPCLLLHTKTQSCEFFNPMYNIIYQSPRLGLSPRTIIYASGHGWLLMGVKYSDDVFFLDPLTRVKIKVPGKPSDVTFGKACFSSSPTSSDCLIVGVSSLSRLLKFVTIKRGEEHWSVEKITTYPPGLTMYPMVCNLVMQNGECYCTDVVGNLGVFDPRDIRGSWRMYGIRPVPKKYWNTLRAYFLVEGNGEIFSVIVFSGGTRRHGGGNRRTCVYKLDVSKSKMKWERVEDLGNRILYVSNATSASTISSIPGMGNKIYFPYFHGKYRDGVFYSLAKKGYYAYGHDSQEEPSRIEQLELIEEFKRATWVLPQFASTTEEDFEW